MPFQTTAFPLPNQVVLFGCFLLYFCCLTCYRLFFSPLSKFPGPKLWAASFWPEFYHDVIRRGKWTWEINAMHKAYGPIIRINPAEIHVSDADYYDTIYAGPTRTTDKYRPAANRFGAGKSMFGIVDHHHHRRLRGAVAPFLSKQSVSKFSDDIQRMIDKLCNRLEGFVGTGQPVNLKYAYIALTSDIITEYAYCKPLGALDEEDFNPMLHSSAMVSSEASHIFSQLEWVFPMLQLLPESFVKKMSPEIGVVLDWTASFKQQIRDFLSGKEDYKNASHPTVFHEMVNNPNMLPEDLTVERLGDEAQTIVSAGYLTTAHTLKVVTYHLLANPPILTQLRHELATISVSPTDTPKYLAALEQLPHLNAVLTESLRRAYGVPHRLQRVAPHDALHYHDWTIPPGTPVSMSSFDLHNDEAVFPDPAAWRPERWLIPIPSSDGRSDKGEAGGGGGVTFNHKLTRYIVPFSRGTRACLGMHLAWAELYLTLAALFSPQGAFGARLGMKLFETGMADVEVQHDFFNPSARLDSRGVRVLVEKRNS